MVMYPHTISILHEIKVPDGGGGYTTDWVPLKDYDCDVVAIGGNEYYQAQQMQNPTEYNINGDYDPDIKKSMRIQFGSETLNITAIIPTLPDINGDFEQMTIKCTSIKV